MDRLTWRDNNGNARLKQGITLQDAYNKMLDIVCNSEDYQERMQQNENRKETSNR